MKGVVFAKLLLHQCCFHYDLETIIHEEPRLHEEIEQDVRECYGAEIPCRARTHVHSKPRKNTLPTA